MQYAGPLGWRRPLVVTVHDLGFLHLPGVVPRRAAASRCACWFRGASRAPRGSITCSEFVRRDIEARYGVPAGRKVVAIPLGAAARFRAAAAGGDRGRARPLRPRPGLSVSRWAGSNRRKNLERLLLAYGRLRAAGVRTLRS